MSDHGQQLSHRRRNIMDEQIKSNLALQIAQLALDKATLEAQVKHLQSEINQLREEKEGD